jgi:hypothetical protein
VNLPGYVDFVGQFFNFKTWTLKISRVTWWVCEKNRPKYFPTLCLSKLIRNNIELARFRTYRTYWFSGWPDWAFFGHFLENYMHKWPKCLVYFCHGNFEVDLKSGLSGGKLRTFEALNFKLIITLGTYTYVSLVKAHQLKRISWNARGS